MYHITSSREQQLCDEVRYLHSLWHQGPPNQNPNPNKPKPKPKPNPPTPAPASSISKVKKKIVKKKTKKPQVEWPCNSPIVEDTRPWAEIGWPENAPKPENFPVPVEEQKRFAAVHLQQKSVKACQDFFSRNTENSNSDSESEEADSSEEDEEEDSMEEDEDGSESEELEFFLGVFKEDHELRNYYEKNMESGEFCCLVCGGIGQKVGKRFKNCVALVQHSVSISKTKRKSAHRAYGKAICRVLGWDINRLPSIVLSLDDPLACHLVEPGNNGSADGSAVKADNVCEDQNGNNCNDVDGSVELDKAGLNSNDDCNKNKVDDKEPLDTPKNADAVEVYNVVGDDEVDIDELYKDLD